MTIGEKIKMLREKAGWTQAQLAEKLFLKQNAISAYEKGVNQPPLEIIKRLTSIFHVSSDFLLDIKNTISPSNFRRVLDSVYDEVIYQESYDFIKNGDISEEAAELLILLIKKDISLMDDIYKR